MPLHREFPLVFTTCKLDARMVVIADCIYMHGCYVAGHGAVTAEVVVEMSGGHRFARISSFEAVTISAESADLLRGASEAMFFTTQLARHLEQTRGVRYRVEWEEVPGLGVDGNPEVDGRLHPR